MKTISAKLGIGEIIRRSRRAKGYSRDELADIIHVSRNSLYNWEKDKNLPDILMGFELANALGVSIYELCGIDDTQMTSDEYSLLKTYRRLSNGGKNLASALTDTLYDQERRSSVKHLRATWRLIPLESTPAAAGVGVPDTETGPEPVFTRLNGQSGEADALVRVSGDSMLPLYKDGDVVMLKYANEIDEGEDAVCVYHEGFIIKRYTGGKLQSLNKELPFGEDHDNDDIRLIGRVLGSVKPHDLIRDITPELEDAFADELKAFDSLHDQG